MPEPSFKDFARIERIDTSFPYPVAAKNLTKRYWLGRTEVTALKSISLELRKSEILAIAGSSGSGKTTLLNLLGCLDTPTSGSVTIDGTDTSTLLPKDLTRFRSEKLGFIFQTFNLIPTLSALENVEYPLLLLRVPSRDRKKRALEALSRVGLEKSTLHRPAELSGGQRQRVAIARAIVKRPSLVLADEPTANLDHHTANEVLDVLCRLNSEDRVAILFSSHDPKILERAHRIFLLTDGEEEEVLRKAA